MTRTRANRRKIARARWTLPRLPSLEIDWRAVLAVTAIVALLAGAGAGAALVLDRPVSKLVVEGTFQRVPAIQVEAAVAGELGRGFLSLDLEALRARVSAIGWVDRVEARRVWPDTLVVRVTEHRAAARWGETGLLNVRGELFTSDSPHAFPELPRLAGPPGTEAEVARRYLAVRDRLAEAHLTLASLGLDARGAWQLVLGGGQEIRLGRRDVNERMARFFEVVVPVLGAELERLRYVDLRYANGFAVGRTAEDLTRERAPQRDGVAGVEEVAGRG